MTEQRRARRFDLRLPIELIRSRRQPLHNSGETRNISSTGVLFTSEAPIPVGAPIEYFITLVRGPDEVRLRCLGKVMRDAGDASFAATLERYEFVRANV